LARVSVRRGLTGVARIDYAAASWAKYTVLGMLLVVAFEVCGCVYFALWPDHVRAIPIAILALATLVGAVRWWRAYVYFRQLLAAQYGSLLTEKLE
jgi:hypothetical protein